MRNDRVLILGLHVAHNTNCFSPCVYSYFHRQLSDNFILFKNGASLRLNHKLSKSLACFDRDESSHHNLSVIFHFRTRMTRKIDKT